MIRGIILAVHKNCARPLGAMEEKAYAAAES